MKTLISLLSILFLSSCAFYSGTTSSSISYNAADAEITDIVSANNSVTRVLGLGGLEREALILETKRKMYQQNPLKKGQMYANIGVDVKQAFYLIVNVETITVSADVLQFYSDTSEHEVFSKLGHKPILLDKEITQEKSYNKEKKPKVNSPFSEGSSIYFVDQKKVFTGTIQTIQDDILRVKKDDGSSSYIDIDKTFHRIFFSDMSKLKQISYRNKEIILEGHIVGYNNKEYIVRSKDNLQVVKKTLVLE